MQKIHKRLAPGNITELSQCEVFVFGSNLEGQHMGGAARYAYDHFGAEWGNGVGPQGQCYAIPTMHGPLSVIKPYVDDFIEYARQHPMNRFLLTRIGCGTAGFKDEDMAPLFKDALEMAKYTPSFHENYWEYAALKVLEIEYGWRYYPGLPKLDEK